MQKYGAAVQEFRIASDPEEAAKATKELGVSEVVVKAQILAGGRGKGTFSSGFQGGVQVTKEYVMHFLIVVIAQ
jgi:succinyl-CoA synthetase beta subunit